MKRHWFHPEADGEYSAAAAYYADVDPQLGGRFYDEMQRAIRAVCASPATYRDIGSGVRRYLAADFPFAILYLDEPDGVWIVAVMHLKRHPHYWQHRLGS